MKIAEIYSHLNGVEFLLARHHDLWRSVLRSIDSVELWNRKADRGHFLKHLSDAGWTKANPVLFEQNEVCARMRGESHSFPQNAVFRLPFSDDALVRDRVALHFDFQRQKRATYDLFLKHLPLYVGDQIDVGIEILPMKSLQANTPSRPASYEAKVYNVIRNGRGAPSVPLVIFGVST
jgi:hypothetical protein